MPRTAPRILVVDNDPRVGPDLEEFFGYSGYEVEIAAETGPPLLIQARALALEFRPHVVVMDLRLLDNEADDLSGLSLLGDECFSSCGRIIYSAYLRYHWDKFIQFREVADFVVAKEHAIEALQDAVNACLGKRCAAYKQFSTLWVDGRTDDAVIDSILGANSGVPSDLLRDVLVQLFPDANTVEMETPEDTTLSIDSPNDRQSVLVRTWIESDQASPFLLKLATRDRIFREAQAYKDHIENRLKGVFYVQVQSRALFWDLGAIRYNFVSGSGNIKTFAAFYQMEPDPARIMEPVRHLFREVWYDQYLDSRARLGSSLFDEYDRYLGLTAQLRHADNQSETLSFDGLRGHFINPIVWVRENKIRSRFPAARQAITHGHLHCENLLTNSQYSWTIDFERTGPGHILRDFIQIEHDIVTRLTPDPDHGNSEFHDLADAILSPEFIVAEPVKLKRAHHQPSYRKALEVIARLRSLANAVTGCDDMREYYWGLLLITLSNALAAASSQRRQRNLLFASVICSRLDHWRKQWPTPNLTLESPRSTNMPVETIYDVFVSYSHIDSDWVLCWLVPKLREAGLRVCIDVDFKFGKPSKIEMQRAVLESESTLLVLTPDYLTSEWTEFEWTMAKNLIPMRLKNCDPPPAINRLVYVDMMIEDKRDAELDRLIRLIKTH